MTDPFRDHLSGRRLAALSAAEQARDRIRRERTAATQAALAGPTGRAFLLARLQAEQQAATWQPGDTIETVAHRAGRVQLLRELLAELDETHTTPGA